MSTHSDSGRAPPANPSTPQYGTRAEDELPPIHGSQTVSGTPEDPNRTGVQPRSVRRTPGAGRLRPKTVKSPHLNRAFEQRQALTPGRRKSRGFYKDSPRDILRQMSRVLPAPTPQQKNPTPRPVRQYQSDAALYEDDSASPKLPPIASNLSESEDDLGPPPRSSMPLDEADVQDVTMEYPLRAPVVRPDYGRDSLGPRASDVHMFAPFSDPREDGGFLRDDLSIQFDDSVHPLDPESTIIQAGDGGTSPLNVTSYNDDILDYQSDVNENTSPGLEESEEVEDAWVDEPTPMPRMTLQSNTKPRKPRVLRQSAYGVEYPPLPSAMIRKLATHLAAGKISKDILRSISEVSDVFFRQTSDSLRAFAHHAGRKTIDDADALQLMMRQRQINSQTTIFLLAQRHLPRELASEVRMRSKR